MISTYSMRFSHDLHKICAYLLHYGSLLDDFRISVEFINNTRNPAIPSPPPEEKSPGLSGTLLKRECENLIREIERLKKEKTMHEERLKNVMQLVSPQIFTFSLELQNIDHVRSIGIQ